MAKYDHGLIGYKGQRYRVTCLDEDNKRFEMGWVFREDGGVLVEVVKLHPSLHTPLVEEVQPTDPEMQGRLTREQIVEQGDQIGHWRGFDQYLMADQTFYLVTKKNFVLGPYPMGLDGRKIIMDFYNY